MSRQRLTAAWPVRQELLCRNLAGRPCIISWWFRSEKDGQWPSNSCPCRTPSDALAPAISAETLGFHHGKHHKAYIDKTNKAVAGTDLDGAAARDGDRIGARGQQGPVQQCRATWNHGFYWNSLSPKPSSRAANLCAGSNPRSTASRSLRRNSPSAAPAILQRLGMARRARGGYAVDRGNPRRRHPRRLLMRGARLLSRLPERAAELSQAGSRRPSQLGFRRREFRARVGLEIPALS